MCGIAGFTGSQDDDLLSRMVALIRPRGPDGEGTWTSPGVSFGHTRLAIVDLVGGVQPMVRENGSCAVTYNGEIYNYKALRAEIEGAGRRFSTNSDTEALPLGYAAFGMDFFKRLNGIFAFALWDVSKRKLLLVRDHFGIKPLYYAKVRGGVAFSSSARAVAAHPDVDRSLNAAAVRDFLQYRYVPNGAHFYTGVHAVPPGCVLEWTEADGIKITPFWTPRLRAKRNDWSKKEWIDRADALLQDAVASQLFSDVPVGLFLSGGVDSSTIASFAAKACPYQMTAYTFSMDDADDELEPARAIAARVGARHVAVHPDQADDFSRLYDAVACMDSPVGDAIILPTYQLCEAAARDLKVVLTGEGADEVFGGYVHFGAFQKLNRLKRMLPFADRLAGLVNFIPLWLLNSQFDYQASLGETGRRKLSRMIGSMRTPGAVFRLASSVIDDEDIRHATDLAPPTPAGDMDLGLSSAMLETVKTWLPNQILNKMDQLSMAHGLEARVPFLDPRVYDLMADAPDEMMLTAKENKIVLRGVLARHGGDAQRPKLAFHVPMETRYQDSLRSLCRQWLSPSETARHGILKQKFVDQNLALLDRQDFIASKRLVTMASLHMWLDAAGR